MTMPTSATGVQIESVEFPPYLKPPGSTKTFFLGGAGTRSLDHDGVVINVTADAIYLEDKAISSIAAKWKGKTATELAESVEFYDDIVTGPFEKLAYATALVPIEGKDFAKNSSGAFAGVLKAKGIYTDADAKTFDHYTEVFKDESFPPGSSILFTTLPAGSLMISIVKDGIMPEAEKAVLENEKLGPTIIEAIIGINGVCPDAKVSLASRLSDFINQ